jgi:hypothetical protein
MSNPEVAMTTPRNQLFSESSPSQRLLSSAEDASNAGDLRQLPRGNGHQYQNILLQDEAKAQLGDIYGDIYGNVKVSGKLIISS